jgi:hypothetical protein
MKHPSKKPSSAFPPYIPEFARGINSKFNDLRPQPVAGCVVCPFAEGNCAAEIGLKGQTRQKSVALAKYYEAVLNWVGVAKVHPKQGDSTVREILKNATAKMKRTLAYDNPDAKLAPFAHGVARHLSASIVPNADFQIRNARKSKEY